MPRPPLPASPRSLYWGDRLHSAPPHAAPPRRQPRHVTPCPCACASRPAAVGPVGAAQPAGSTGRPALAACGGAGPAALRRPDARCEVRLPDPDRSLCGRRPAGPHGTAAGRGQHREAGSHPNPLCAGRRRRQGLQHGRPGHGPGPLAADGRGRHPCRAALASAPAGLRPAARLPAAGAGGDRKSTRLNSSHLVISYAVFCLKKKITACQTASTCASTASQKETLLLQAGFKSKTVTTPKQQERVSALPEGKVSAVKYKGRTYYVYPTATKNRILVGNQAQFNAYKQSLQAQRNQLIGPVFEEEIHGPHPIQVQEFDGFGPLGE